MPDEFTRADGLRVFLTGASVDGGAQVDPDLSLGNFRSSTLALFLSFIVTNPISNLTVDFVAGSNGEGAGSLEATGDDTFRWTPPGGSAGADVTILNGETKIAEGGADKVKYIRVSRTTGANLSGTATVTTTINFNGLVGFDNVGSGEAAAGDTEYRAAMFKNVSAGQITNLVVFISQLGVSNVSDGAQLPASGAGSVQVLSGDFSTWSQTGWVRIEDSGGTLKEIAYFSSRTADTLTIPSTGRGRLGTSATAGAATDNIFSVPGIRIGQDPPSTQPTGNIVDNTGADEDTAPGGVTFNSSILPANGEIIGTLEAGEIFGLWFEREVPVDVIATSNVVNDASYNFDIA